MSLFVLSLNHSQSVLRILRVSGLIIALIREHIFYGYKNASLIDLVLEHVNIKYNTVSSMFSLHIASDLFIYPLYFPNNNSFYSLIFTVHDFSNISNYKIQFKYMKHHTVSNMTTCTCKSQLLMIFNNSISIILLNHDLISILPVLIGNCN